MSAHAVRSPSSSGRWLYCTKSLEMEQGIADKPGVYAAEGTAAHFLGYIALVEQKPCEHWKGQFISVDPNGECECHSETPPDNKGLTLFEVDAEMIKAVQQYVDLVNNLDGEKFYEKQLPIEDLTHEHNAVGTVDAVAINNSEIVVVDFKYGKGVKVNVEGNTQLMIYALSALIEYGFMYDIKSIRMVICQPRLNNIDEWVIDISELLEFGEKVKEVCKNINDGKTYYSPTESTCRWCKAKATCPALTEHVLNTVADDFVNMDVDLRPQLADCKSNVTNSDNEKIAKLLPVVDLIEGFCEAVKTKAESELLSGNAIPGYKLVEGRKGARKWIDVDEAEKAFKAARFRKDDMYSMLLISPTQAQKLVDSGVIGIRKWNKIQKLIVQPKGKPTVVSESDKRKPIIVNSVDDFDII